MKASGSFNLLSSTSIEADALDSVDAIVEIVETRLRAGDKSFESEIREIIQTHHHRSSFDPWFAEIINRVLSRNPPSAPRYKIVKKVLHQESLRLTREQAEKRTLDQYETRRLSAWSEYRDWLKSSPPPPLQMQKPDGSVVARLILDIDNGLLFGAQQMSRSTLERAMRDSVEESSKYVLEHDWASAFKGASDYAGGEFTLPDAVCLFEMKIDGRPVAAIATLDQEMLVCTAMLRLKTGWVVQGTFAGDGTGSLFSYTADGKTGADFQQGGTFHPLTPNATDHRLSTAVFNQVRAASIAMEANVAEASDPIRADYRRNSPASNRSLPGYSYHVVSLARRSNRAPALPRGGDDPGRHVRLHFRRGHWRHYEAHKTWIKWTLVGDPDLGFVDKHYRL